MFEFFFYCGFLKKKYGRKVCVIDSIGLLGSLLASWNPLSAHLKHFQTCGSILLELNMKGFSHSFYIINCLGPYKYLEFFWNSVENNGLLNICNIILVGNLNFTLFATEIWGEIPSLDPMSYCFLTVILET